MSTRTSPAARIVALVSLVALVALVGAFLLRAPAAEPDATGEAAVAAQRPAASNHEDAPERGLASARTPPIRGIIRAAAGPPIAGALVCAAPWTPPQSRGRWRWRPTLAGLLATICGRSDDAGRFALASGRGRFSVRASARGHFTASHEAPVLIAPAQASPELELTLEAGGRTIRGRVVDRFGGPIDGVLIASDDGGFAIADDEGGFELVAVASPAILVPWSPGYVSRAVLTPAPAADVVVTMTPEAVIEGRVVDAAGDPVAEIDVRTGRRDSEEITTTDARGHFRLTGLLPGVVQLRALDDDHDGAAGGATLGCRIAARELAYRCYPQRRRRAVARSTLLSSFLSLRLRQKLQQQHQRRPSSVELRSSSRAGLGLRSVKGRPRGERGLSLTAASKRGSSLDIHPVRAQHRHQGSVKVQGGGKASIP